MTTWMRFNVATGWDPKQATRALGDGAEPELMSETEGRLAILDTFDWRLYRKGAALYQLADGLYLCPLGDEEAMIAAPGVTASRFAADLPKGEMRKRLKALAGVRALLPMAEAPCRTARYRLADDHGRPLAELTLVEARPPHGNRRVGQLWVRTLSAHPSGRRRVVALLTEQGLERVKEAEDDLLYGELLAAAGQTPGGYTAGVTVELDPAMPSVEALSLVLGDLLHVMQVNEPYVVEDVDIEFLHDYRVALRRTRSVLAQMKGVFPSAEVRRFRQAFAELGEVTNPLRDLDVYLTRQKEYTRLLPDPLRPAIAPLFDHLRRLRGEALSAVVARLTADEHSRLMAEWQAFLEQPPFDPEAANAAVPIGVLVRQRLLKRYRTMAEEAARLARSSDPQALHALRIQGKKLRYLLEVFAGLFPSKKVAALVDHLKHLQDVLGDINDLSVQETYLQRVAQDLPLDGSDSRITLVAVGVLIGKLDDQRQALRAQIGEALAELTAEKTATLVAELFEMDDD